MDESLRGNVIGASALCAATDQGKWLVNNSEVQANAAAAAISKAYEPDGGSNLAKLAEQTGIYLASN